MSESPIISVSNVTKRFGSFTALEDISIDVKPGEILALLGPSGCGKSTLLRIIAGFETPTEGDVLIEGKDVTDVPPNKRPINMVFQSYAVFPHMSVEKNVAYGLKMDRRPAAEIDAKVAEALAQVHLSEFAQRKPDQLSGGQRQRVALARALVKRPRVLLLDEPLSALDAKLRDAMRLELVKLQQTVGISFVIVTHDQSEALAMADRIVVLEAGKIRQIASPVELYRKPSDAFVADFIGRVNLFDVSEATPGDVNVTVESLGPVQLPYAAPEGIENGAVLAVRPEHVAVSLQKEGAPGAELQGVLGDVAFQGETSLVEVTLDGDKTILALVQEEEAETLLRQDPGTAVTVSFDLEKTALLRR